MVRPLRLGLVRDPHLQREASLPGQPANRRSRGVLVLHVDRTIVPQADWLALCDRERPTRTMARSRLDHWCWKRPVVERAQGNVGGAQRLRPHPRGVDSCGASPLSSTKQACRTGDIVVSGDPSVVPNATATARSRRIPWRGHSEAAPSTSELVAAENLRQRRALRVSPLTAACGKAVSMPNQERTAVWLTADEGAVRARVSVRMIYAAVEAASTSARHAWPVAGPSVSDPNGLMNGLTRRQCRSRSVARGW